MAVYHDAHILALRGAALHHGLGAVSHIATLEKSPLGELLYANGVTAAHIIDSEKTYADHWRSHGVVASIAAATAAAPSVSPAAVQSIVNTAVSTFNDDIVRLRESDRDILDSIRNTNDNLVDVNRRLDDAVTRLSSEIKSAAPAINADSAVADAVDKAFGKFRKLVEDNGAEQIVADATGVRIIGQKSALEVFGVDVRDAAGNPILVSLFNHPEAPAIDDSYIWPEEALRLTLLVQSQSLAESSVFPPNIWLAGDRGTGKTQFASQFAARTGCQLVRINFDRHLERLDFIGSKGLVNGETVWQDGTFLKAFKQTGTVLLLDEFGFANPANVANLQGLLEPNAAVTYDGVTHRRATGVIVFAADNSTGNRDDSNRFKGVQEQNSALLDRFPFTTVFEFLPAKVESALIQKRTGATKKLADAIVKVLNVARKETQSGEIIDAPSLRQAFALASAITAGISPDIAWTVTITNKSPSESRAALDAIKATHFNI
jgi:MoxR-like ATPase